jgi:hypothetical protein
MQIPKSFSGGLSMIASASVLIATFTTPVRGQDTPAITVGNVKIAGLPDDWTHHHVAFSDPGSADDAARNGTYDKWFEIVNDPRYVMQQLKRGLAVQGSAAVDATWIEAARRARREPGAWGFERRKLEQPAIDKDWSMVLGSGAAGVGAGRYPAKFSFNATSSSPINCASATNPDYVVYNTGATGSTTQASVVAYDNLYGGTPTPACSGQVPSVYWAFNTSGKVVTSVVLSLNGEQLAYVQTPSSGNAQLVILTWSKTPAGRSVTGSLSAASPEVTLTSGTTFTSADVGAVMSGTGITGAVTIASVLSSTTANLATAPSTQAAESLAITADAGGPDTLANNASYPSCTAPCAAILTFSGTSRADTISSPYYDYSSDTLYVGDASGGLHKFHPLFNGTPAEVLTSGGPWAAVSTQTAPALSSPVYDNVDDLVFVGDASGYIYSVNSSGTSTKSVQVAVSPGIVDGPLVDITNGFVYATVSNDDSSTTATNACDGNTSSKSCNGVIQLPVGFGTTTTFNESVMGIGTTNALYDGSFDNQYWASGTGTGNMYVIGNNATPAPKLSEIPISANVLQTGGACQGGFNKPPNSNVVVCSVNVTNPITATGDAAAGSPLTEILNGANDYLFAGVTADGNTTGCTGSGGTNGCVYSWNAASTLAAGTAATAGGTALGGTSGIIVDNVSATTGASEIYFSTLGATGTCSTSGMVTAGSCAIQATQSAP